MNIRTLVTSTIGTVLCSAVALGALAGINAIPAAAATLPSGATDPNFCADYGQSVGGSYDGVKACSGPLIGAIEFRGTNGSVITSDTVGFQCVELVARYLYAAKGWGVIDVNGEHLVSAYGSAHGVNPVVAGRGVAPVPGDVISFSVSSSFSNSYSGHTAIITNVTSDSVSILSENWGGTAAPATLSMNPTTKAISGVYTSSGYASYIEWLPISGGTTHGYGPYKVVGTGSNGLWEHSTPSTSASHVGLLTNGTSVYLACQLAGAVYSTGGTPATDPMWDQLTTGAWVADYWMSTPAVGTYSPGIPHCS